VLDLRGLTFIDSSGLGTLLNLRGELRREGVAMVVDTQDGPIRRALESTGLGRAAQPVGRRSAGAVLGRARRLEGDDLMGAVAERAQARLAATAQGDHSAVDHDLVAVLVGHAERAPDEQRPVAVGRDDHSGTGSGR
jgi:hypothetical protein